LAAGFNIVIYGIGSKRGLLEHFCKDALQKYTYLIFDGYQPAVNSHLIIQVNFFFSFFAFFASVQCRKYILTKGSKLLSQEPEKLES
uniref:Origin recognition complex subunit 2 n=1 Tax=Gongylonema pulchrum TaxID=637853 RepID=A0A183DD88_9BILA